MSVRGFDVQTHYAEARRQLGVVPQEFNFGIFEKVLDVVLDQAGYYGLSRSEALPKAEKLLQSLGLFEKRNDQSRFLSGGMKRRLMIARALVHDPTILILDEPTTGVDQAAQTDFYALLKRLNEEHGLTILLISHDLEVIAHETKKALCLNRSLVHMGPAETLHDEEVLYKLFGDRIHHH